MIWQPLAADENKLVKEKYENIFLQRKHCFSYSRFHAELLDMEANIFDHRG